jgi:hypothetical protein
VSKQYATRFIAYVENDEVPGVEKSLVDPSIITFWPFGDVDLETSEEPVTEFPDKDDEE